MKVSLPKLASPAMPPKTFLPGSGTTSGKFSTFLAGAQDGADASAPDALNAGGNQAPKKMPSRGDKSNSKSRAANDGSTLQKAQSAVDSTAHEVRAALTSATHASSENDTALQMPRADSSDEPSDELATAKSTSDSIAATGPRRSMTDFGPVFSLRAAKSPAASTLLPPRDAAPADVVADNQLSPISSTTLLGTWMAPEEGTGLKPLSAPPAANLGAFATPNGKPATAGIKTVSGDTAGGATFAIDYKARDGFTFLQAHTAASTPSTVSVPANSNSETRREMLQGHGLSGSTLGRQEKPKAQTSFETNKKDSDGGRDEATPFARGNSPSPATAASDIHGAESFVMPAGSTVSMHASTPDAGNRAGGFSKTSTPTAGQSMAAAEDMEAASEGGALGLSSPLHTARLVAGMERSELRVGLRTGEFGNVDIRTSMIHNQFIAEISVERGELGRALAAELPSLQHRLTEQHVSAANITVQDNSGGGTAESRQGSRQSQSAPPVSGSSMRTHEDSASARLSAEVTEATSRLDIHM